MADPTTSPNEDDDDSTFETSTQEANHSIEQGNGVGAREMAAQRDPTETAEHDPFKDRQENHELETPVGENDLA